MTMWYNWPSKKVETSSFLKGFGEFCCGRLSGFGFQGIGSWSDEKWQILKGLRKAGHQSKTHYTVLVTRWCSPYIIILPYYCLRHGKFRKALVPWHCNASYGQTVAQAVHTPFSKPLHFAPGQKHTCFSLRHVFGMSFQKKHSWKCVDCSVQNGIPCWSTENLIKQDSVIRLSLLGCDPLPKKKRPTTSCFVQTTEHY